MVHVFDITTPTPLSHTTIAVTNPRDVICTYGKMIVSAESSFGFYNISDMSNIKLIGSIAK